MSGCMCVFQLDQLVVDAAKDKRDMEQKHSTIQQKVHTCLLFLLSCYCCVVFLKRALSSTGKLGMDMMLSLLNETLFNKRKH